MSSAEAGHREMVREANAQVFLYRCIGQRARRSPLFLNRNVSYLRDPKRPRVRRRTVTDARTATAPLVGLAVTIRGTCFGADDEWTVQLCRADAARSAVGVSGATPSVAVDVGTGPGCMCTVALALPDGVGPVADEGFYLVLSSSSTAIRGVFPWDGRDVRQAIVALVDAAHGEYRGLTVVVDVKWQLGNVAAAAEDVDDDEMDLSVASAPTSAVRTPVMVVHFHFRPTEAVETYAHLQCGICGQRMPHVSALIMHSNVSHDKFAFQVEQPAVGPVRVHISFPSAERLLAADSQRLGHRTVTSLPLMDHEVDRDSDDEVDERWQKGICDVMLDEFTDVRTKEKVFFKQWNTTIRAQSIRSDLLLRDVLDKFVRAKAHWIMSNGLRNTFATFLIHLWMQCLLPRRDMERLLVTVDGTPTGDKVTLNDGDNEAN